MKIITLFTFLMLSVAIQGRAQKSVTMCHGSATEAFARLADNEAFRAEHQTPADYVHQSEAGKQVTFKATDGKDAYGYFLPAESSSDQYLFVFHEWWGLNEWVKKQAEQLYNDLGNVNVLAVDLYDQQQAQSREQAQSLMQSVQEKRAKAIIDGAAKYAGDEAIIATIGWCFGGGWSLQAALLLENQANGCVMYYGMPVKDVSRLMTLQCDVLGIFASQDKWVNSDVVKAFANNMEQTDQELTYKIFDANHAFANPSNPDYNSEATKQAYQMTLDFLKERF